MKVSFKQFLFSLIGLLLFSHAYSSEVVSNEEKSNNSSEAISNTQKMPVPATNTSENTDKVVSEVQATEPTEKTKEEMTGFSRGIVARSLFTTLIDNREPVDKVKQVPVQTNDVFYYTELREMSGQTVKHRWEYKGKVIAEVNFKVRGPRWRVWSKKSFQPGWAGDWKVSVLNGADEVISEEMIAYTEPSRDVIENKAMPKPIDNKMLTEPEAVNSPSSSDSN